MKSQIPILLELSSLKGERNSWEWLEQQSLCSLSRDNLTLYCLSRPAGSRENSPLFRELSLLRPCNSAWSIMSPREYWLAGWLVYWLIGEVGKELIDQCCLSALPFPHLLWDRVTLLWFLLGPKHTRDCWYINLSGLAGFFSDDSVLSPSLIEWLLATFRLSILRTEYLTISWMYLTIWH